MNNIELTIVVPVFNEEGRLDGLKIICKWLLTMKIKSELIIVDDGSTDRTLKLLKNYNYLSYLPNKGKGYAVKQGVLASHGKWVMICDVDLSVDPASMKKIWLARQQKCVVIGSRRVRGAKIVVRQGWFRELLGIGFSKFAGMVSGIRVTDFTCGCKLIPGVDGRKVFKQMNINRWAYDVEMLWRFARRGMKIVEVPVIWKNDANTKVKLGKDVLVSFYELMVLRVRGSR